MATEMARYAFYGMIIGAVFFGFVISWMYVTSPRYTDEQKAEMNNAYAVNCSKCLEKENISCTPKELIYSQWGAICNAKYVSKNCTSCKQV